MSGHHRQCRVVAGQMRRENRVNVLDHYKQFWCEWMVGRQRCTLDVEIFSEEAC